MPSFGNLFVYISFTINQSEIIKSICVQRKSVFNTCNGRCELKKNLKKFEDEEKKMQNNLKEKFELVYIQNIIEKNVFSIKNSENQLSSISPFTKKPISVSISTFRPPTFFI